MGKVTKVFVCGMKGVGKTAFLHQLIYGKVDYQDIHPTIEDMYAATAVTEKGTREVLRFYDMEGLSPSDDASGETLLPRQVYSIGDAFVLLYSLQNSQSFEAIDAIKRDIERNRDKREILIVAVGLHSSYDHQGQGIEPTYAAAWANREKVRHFHCILSNRESLFPPIVYIVSKLSLPPAKTTFAPLGIVRKTKDVGATGSAAKS